MKLQSLLTTKGSQVFTIHPHQTVREAVAVFAQHNIGALVVVDEHGKLVGILSERDVMRALTSHEDVLAHTVNQIMTRRVVVASPDDDLSSVMHTMTEKRFRHIPVLEQGKLIGIISIGDAVKAQLVEYEGELETLQTAVEGE